MTKTVTWLKKLLNNPTKDMTKYYEFYKDHDHHTIDCRLYKLKLPSY